MSSSDQLTENRGGKRRNAGRKIEIQGAGGVSKHTVTLDELTLRMLKVLGDGNASRGIRKAARHSYDAFQADKLT